MSKKTKLIILAAVLVILIGGASLIYPKLAEIQKTNPLSDQLGTSSQNNSWSGDAVDVEDGKETDDSKTPSADNSSTHTNPKAYDFTAYDSVGKAVKLSDYIGKPIVLNFWASWCGPCGSEMPDFNQKYLEIGDEVQFLMVNLTAGRETVTTAQNFIKKNGYSFPVLFDKDEDAANAYRVYSIPTTYFINSDGYLVAQATGAISADVLQQGIDLINK